MRPDDEDIEGWWALVHPPAPLSPAEILQAALPSEYGKEPPTLLTALGSAKDFHEAVRLFNARHKLVLEGPVDDGLRNLLRLLVSKQGPTGAHPVGVVLQGVRRLAREQDLFYAWVRRSPLLATGFKPLLNAVVYADLEEEQDIQRAVTKWVEGDALDEEEGFLLFDPSSEFPTAAATSAERVSRIWGLILLAFASIRNLPRALIVCDLHDHPPVQHLLDLALHVKASSVWGPQHTPATLLFGWDGQDSQRVGPVLHGILRETELVLRPESRDEQRIHPEGRSFRTLRWG